jgi:hypothetical protein
MAVEGEYRVYVVRREHQKEWLAKAQGGDETAKVCMWAGKNFMKAMRQEHSVCACCDRVFSGVDIPRAMVVLIPAEPDPEKVKAQAGGVCAECSKHDDQWLVDESTRRIGLSKAGMRPGDKAH